MVVSSEHVVPIIFVYNFTDFEMSFFLFPTKYKRKIRHKYDFEDFRNIRVDKIEYKPIFKDLCKGISECYLFIFYFHRLISLFQIFYVSFAILTFFIQYFNITRACCMGHYSIMVQINIHVHYTCSSQIVER